MTRRTSKARAKVRPEHPHWRNLRHPFAPQSLFSDDRIEHMHETALTVLRDLGVRVLLNEVRDLCRTAGARVRDDMVYFDRDMVEAALMSAPASVPLAAPDPAYDLTFEEGAMIFGPGAGCPNVADSVSGRRPGTLAAYRDALRLAQSFDVIHLLGPCCEPQDIPVHLRHYDLMQSQLTLSGKFPFIFGRGRQQVTESLEMIQMASGLSDEAFRATARCCTVVNTNSPRQIDKPMGQALIDFARAGQLTIITPFCLSGAMAPITVAGALVLQHAEALAALVITQMACSGAPVAMGGFGSNVDMKSGAPAFGTPEHIQMSIGTGQLCRFIGLPWRGASGAAANTTDMQAAGETHMGLWGALMGNAGMIFHSAGWLEGGLTFGFEKFINDVEALQTIATLCTAPDASDDALGYGAIAEVDPGGHFFATAQTLARYETAFYHPLVADLNNFGAWTEAGSVDAAARATGIWQDVITGFTPPKGADERGEAISRFIADRRQAGGAPVLE